MGARYVGCAGTMAAGPSIQEVDKKERDGGANEGTDDAIEALCQNQPALRLRDDENGEQCRSRAHAREKVALASAPGIRHIPNRWQAPR